MLYQPRVTKEDILSFNKQYSPQETDVYQSSQLVIMRDCPTDISSYDTIIVSRSLLQDSTTCKNVKSRIADPTSTLTQLVSPKDSGVERLIIGDQLCASVTLKNYVHPTSLSDFNLKKLAPNDFCYKWVVKQ